MIKILPEIMVEGIVKRVAIHFARMVNILMENKDGNV
jgi:hypothetical protein